MTDLVDAVRSRGGSWRGSAGVPCQDGRMVRAREENSDGAAGRPRDPAVDMRIARAALEIFGEGGWPSLSMEGIARRAGVGKASLYLRWSDRETLLVDAFEARVPPIQDVDTGSLREDLVELARQMLELYFSPEGGAMLRLSFDRPHSATLAQRLERHRAGQVLAARAIVRRGIERGELPADTNVTVLLDSLIGGLMMHALASVSAPQDQVRASLAEYPGELVSVLLRGVGAQT